MFLGWIASVILINKGSRSILHCFVISWYGIPIFNQPQCWPEIIKGLWRCLLGFPILPSHGLEPMRRCSKLKKMLEVTVALPSGRDRNGSGGCCANLWGTVGSGHVQCTTTKIGKQKCLSSSKLFVQVSSRSELSKFPSNHLGNKNGHVDNWGIFPHLPSEGL